MNTKKEEIQKEIADLDDDIIFWTIIPKSEIQQWAESNFGRELTDIELNRILECWAECERAMDARTDLLDALIEDALNNEDNSWEVVDKDFLTGNDTNTLSHPEKG